MTRAQNSRILDQIYDVAVDPARLEVLLESWERMASEGGGVAEGFTGLDVETHFNRASVLLDRWKHDEEAETGKFSSVLDRFRKVAAFTVGRTLKVRAVNSGAARTLELEPGDALSNLPLEEDDLAVFRTEILKTLSERSGETGILRFLSRNTGRIMVFQTKAAHDPLEGPFAVVVTSETGWPEGFQGLLAQTFGLSKSEIAVLRGVVECTSLREIARQRGRSVETVRAQVRAIMAKTDTHSQAELVRMVLALLYVVSDMEESHEPEYPSENRTLVPAPPQFVRRCDGRRVEYLVLGDKDGRPCLFLPTDYGLVRWPSRAEAEAKRRNIRVIVPIRGGFGGSDFYARGADMAEEIVMDMQAILDREAVRHCPIIALAGDSFFTFLFAARFPERVSAIILCDPLYPLSTPEQYGRMDRWYRFILANARYAPHLLPFMVKAGMHLARKVGKRNFVNMVFGSSAGDIETSRDPQVFEAIVTGTDVVVSRDRLAHEAFCAELLLQERVDWRPHIRKTVGLMPVYSLHGEQSQIIVAETLNELREEYTGIDFRVYPDIGALLFFKEWRDVLDLAEEYLEKHPAK